MSTFKELVEVSLPLYTPDMGFESAGRKNAATGADLENLVITTNAAYWRMQRGFVKKNEIRMIVKRGGQVVRTRKSTVDFDGYLTGIGFVAFDCKTCDGEVWRPSRDQLHQFMYLLSGQRTMPREMARFFYIVQMKSVDTSHGSFRNVTRTYLVEDLETIVEAGEYRPRERDQVHDGAGGVLLDYRSRLIHS